MASPMHNIYKELELLTRHVRVLKTIVNHEPIGIVKISKLIGLPKHQVRYSMRVLQQCGFLEPTTRGAKSNKKGKQFLKNFKKEKRSIIDKLKIIDP
jgi:predicted transcriptional regulator